MMCLPTRILSVFLYQSPQRLKGSIFCIEHLNSGVCLHLTGHGGVEGEGPEAGELLPSGFLHAVAEDILPGVKLQQLYTLQDLRGLLQTICRVLLKAEENKVTKGCEILGLHHEVCRKYDTCRGGKQWSTNTLLLYLSTFLWYQYFTPLLIFLTTFYFDFLHFEHKYLNFLLLTW